MQAVLPMCLCFFGFLRPILTHYVELDYGSHEGVWGYMEVSCKLHVPAVLPLEKNHGSHCVGDCAGRGANLAVSKKRIISCACRVSNPGPSRQYHSHCTDSATQGIIHASIVKGKDHPMTCLCSLRREYPTPSQPQH
jgi:hypothetical protein